MPELVAEEQVQSRRQWRITGIVKNMIIVRASTLLLDSFPLKAVPFVLTKKTCRIAN